MQRRPPSLLGAAAVQAADAVVVLVASVLAGADTIAGRSYQEGSGIALTLIGIGTAVALAWVAVGLSRARRWSRTPAALTQLFVGIVGVYLVQGHRYAWGIPSLVLACAGMALLLVPASLRALAGPGPGMVADPKRHPGPPQASGQAGPRPRCQVRPRRRRGRSPRPGRGLPPSRPRRESAPPAASPPGRLVPGFCGFVGFRAPGR